MKQLDTFLYYAERGVQFCDRQLTRFVQWAANNRLEALAAAILAGLIVASIITGVSIK